MTRGSRLPGATLLGSRRGARACRPGLRRGAWTATTLFALLLVLAAERLPVSDPRPARAQAEPTPTPWTPAGTWRALHGPALAPLWRTGKTQRERPCGTEPRGGALRSGLVAPLCAVHGVTLPDGSWTGWAVGEEGLLARYAAGAWQAVADLDPRATSPRTYHLHDVYVVAPDDVWVLGWMEGDRICADCGVLLHYDGESWTPLEKQDLGINACVPKLNALDMARDGEGEWFGWAIGDKERCLNGGALVLEYDGQEWKWFRAPQLERNMHDLRIVSREEAWAVGDFGSESYYNDVGHNKGDWPLQGRSGAHDLFAVDLTEPTHGWDGGVVGRLNRYDGNCHDDDQNTPCWFDNQASPIRSHLGQKATNSVYAIDLLTRGQGWLVGAQDSRKALVAHFSSGSRWLGVLVEEDPGKSLYGLHMVSERHGFAVGDEGAILEYRDASLPEPSPSATEEPPTPTPAPSATATPGATASPTLSPDPEPSATEVPPSLTPSPTPTMTGGGPEPSATPTAPSPTPPDPASPTAAATGTATHRPSATPRPPGRIYLPMAIAARPRR